MGFSPLQFKRKNRYFISNSARPDYKNAPSQFIIYGQTNKLINQEVHISAHKKIITVTKIIYKQKPAYT
jgi:hypothetical protein